MKSLGVLAAGVGLVLGPVVAGHAAAAPVVPAAAEVATSAFSEAVSKQLAKTQGQRVEVTSLRSETDQVFANPDGTMTREQFLEPVRVRRGERWLAVDSTLVRRADGSWGPRAAAVDMSFSNGGSGPAVRFGHGNAHLDLTWPQALPTPVVDGASVSYREVLPGVDLELTAVGTSFTQHLVVKSRAAGLNPKVRSFTMKASVRGGTLAQDGAGYAVKDETGRNVVTGAQPVMWDSKSRPAGAAAAALDAVVPRIDEGDRQAPMRLTVAKDAVTIRPDATLLDAPSTVFPVVLDPTTSPSIYNWAMVNETYSKVSYYNWTSADEGVGYNDFESPANRKRLFFSFPTSAYNGKIVSSATLRAYETYSATCAAGTVNAYLAGDLSSGVTWNTQPGKLIAGALDSWSTKAGRSDCYPGGKTAAWDVTAGVQNRVAAKASRSTFLLQGASESTNSSWMRFGGPKNSTSSKRPSLSVTYNSKPTTPLLDAMWVPTATKKCTSAADNAAPVINPTTGATDTMYAKISDPDGDNLTAELQILKADNTSLSITPFTSRASGSTISMTVPSNLGSGSYKYRVRAKDASVWSAWGQYCYFTVDTTRPPTPIITSSTWTEGVLAPASATSGQITMTSRGSTRIAYRWNSATSANASTTSTGSVTYSTTMTQPLDFWHAQSNTASGTLSYTGYFYVKRAQPGKLAEYPFNGRIPDGDAPARCSALPYEATCDVSNDQLNSNADLTDPAAATSYKFDLPPEQDNFDMGRWGDGADPNNHSLYLDGSATTTAELVSRPVVNTESFTIGAWARLDDGTQSRTLLAQQRDPNPSTPETAALSYDVGYDATKDKFVARLMNSAGAVIATAQDNLPATLPGSTDPYDRVGTWTYLAVAYNQASGKLRLDAMSALEMNPLESDFSDYRTGTEVSVTGTPAPGLGSFTLGGGTSAVGGRAAWSGAVDNVAVWQGLPTANPTLLANANHQW